MGSTQRAKERTKQAAKKPAKKQVQGNKLTRNKNRTPKPQKHTVPWSNQYGDSSTWKRVTTNGRTG